MEAPSENHDNNNNNELPAEAAVEAENEEDVDEEEDDDINDDDGDDGEESSMRLEEEELQWALELKQALKDWEESDDNDNNITIAISDFEIAHHAIVAQGNVEEAIDRIVGLQHFREEYKIDTTSTPQGLIALQRFLDLYPDSAMYVSKDESAGTGMVVWAFDQGQVNYSNAMKGDKQTKTDSNWRTHVVGMHWVAQSCFPNLLAIRKGSICLCDCGGMGWNNVSVQWESRMQSELMQHYPAKPAKIFFYNTSAAFNIFFSMVKPLMPKIIQDKVRVGCHLDDVEGGAAWDYPTAPNASSGGRLREIFLLPTLDQARMTLEESYTNLLMERNHNEKVFRLPSNEEA